MKNIPYSKNFIKFTISSLLLLPLQPVYAEGVGVVDSTGQSLGLVTQKMLPLVDPKFYGVSGNQEVRAVSLLATTSTSSTGSIQVSVRNPAHSSNGMDNLNVHITDMKSNLISPAQALTAGGGNYKLDNVPPGTYNVSIDDGTVTITTPVTVNRTTANVLSTFINDKNIDRNKNGAIGGIIYGADGNPLGNAAVKITNTSSSYWVTKTNAAGRFKVYLPIGRYNLLVYGDSDPTHKYKNMLYKNISVQAGQLTSPYDDLNAQIAWGQNDTLGLSVDASSIKKTDKMIKGFANPGSLIKVWDVTTGDSIVIGQTIALSNHSFTVPLKTIPAGKTLVISAEDDAGNTYSTGQIMISPLSATDMGLAPDNTDNTVDKPIDITFKDPYGVVTPNITVMVDKNSLSKGTDYTVTPGKITIKPGKAGKTAGPHSIAIQAGTYGSAVVTQALNAGTAYTGQTSISTAPSLDQGVVSTITITAKDQYGNTITNRQLYMNIAVINKNSTTSESYTVNSAIYKASASSKLAGSVTDQNGVTQFSVALPPTIDGNDGLSIQIVDKGVNVGAPISYMRGQSTAPTPDSITIQNNPTGDDLVVFGYVPAGASVNVYNTASGGVLLGSGTNPSSTAGPVTVTVPNGFDSAITSIYATVTEPGKSESSRTQKAIQSMNTDIRVVPGQEAFFSTVDFSSGNIQPISGTSVKALKNALMVDGGKGVLKVYTDSSKTMEADGTSVIQGTMVVQAIAQDGYNKKDYGLAINSLGATAILNAQSGQSICKVDEASRTVKVLGGSTVSQMIGQLKEANRGTLKVFTDSTKRNEAAGSLFITPFMVIDVTSQDSSTRQTYGISPIASVSSINQTVVPAIIGTMIYVQPGVTVNQLNQAVTVDSINVSGGPGSFVVYSDSTKLNPASTGYVVTSGMVVEATAQDLSKQTYTINAPTGNGNTIISTNTAVVSALNGNTLTIADGSSVDDVKNALSTNNGGIIKIYTDSTKQNEALGTDKVTASMVVENTVNSTKQIYTIVTSSSKPVITSGNTNTAVVVPASSQISVPSGKTVNDLKAALSVTGGTIKVYTDGSLTNEAVGTYLVTGAMVVEASTLNGASKQDYTVQSTAAPNNSTAVTTIDSSVALPPAADGSPITVTNGSTVDQLKAVLKIDGGVGTFKVYTDNTLSVLANGGAPVGSSMVVVAVAQDGSSSKNYTITVQSNNTALVSNNSATAIVRTDVSNTVSVAGGTTVSQLKGLLQVDGGKGSLKIYANRSKTAESSDSAAVSGLMVIEATAQNGITKQVYTVEPVLTNLQNSIVALSLGDHKITVASGTLVSALKAALKVDGGSGIMNVYNTSSKISLAKDTDTVVSTAYPNKILEVISQDGMSKAVYTLQTQ